MIGETFKVVLKFPLFCDMRNKAYIDLRGKP